MKTEELFIEYMDNLYRIAVFMLSNVQDAEDAVQETYVRYLLKKPKLNNQEHEKAWLMRVCINICKNQIRYRNRHPKYNIDRNRIRGKRNFKRNFTITSKTEEKIVRLASCLFQSVGQLAALRQFSYLAIPK